MARDNFQSERIVIVSNRGPVTYSRSESGGLEYSRGSGGLVTALNAISRQGENTVWISSAQSEADVEISRESGGEPFEVEDLTLAFVEHDREAYDLMYSQLANPLLWFVQHGLYDIPYEPALGEDTKHAWENGYVPTNRNFADAVVRVIDVEKPPTILLHDYHLYMVPHFLRERLGEEAFISLFVHIPWPEPEDWRILPRYIREGALESLLRANLLGFHTRAYAYNFIETARVVLGAEVDPDEGWIRYEGREVWARAYPISIDVSEFEEMSGSEAVLEENEFVEGLPGKLLLRVDRMDLSKNIVRGFRAYSRMLEKYPDMHGKVTFLAQLQPSREDVPEYAAYAETIEKTVDEVNERHGTNSWQPIYLSGEENFPRTVAAYRKYDALLVNAVRDGMNLVAKESAVVNETSGVLILSEGAGAHEELGEHALTVNPFDVDEQADAIHQALTMPQNEKEHRARALRDAVLSNTIEDWAEAQMRDIAAYREQYE